MPKTKLLVLSISCLAVAAVTTATASHFIPKKLDLYEVTDAADFEIRDTSQPFKFNGEMWMSNGYLTNDIAYRDLWKSTDGFKWRKINGSTPYDPYSAIAVKDGYIYAAKNTVWRSRDGKNWELLKSDGPVSAQDSLPLMRSFKGKLWLFDHEQVYSSSDGREWDKHDAPYGHRRSYTVAVFKGALWVIGGGLLEPANPPEKQYVERTAMNDVWRSEDGVHWQLVTADPGFSPRMWPTSVVHKDRLYIVAGFSNKKAKNLHGIWSSADGANWEKVVTPTKLPARHWPSVWSFGDDIIIAAGNGWPLRNDVWRLGLK
jgi:hypothetical protein